MEKYSLEPYKDKDEVSDFRKEEAYLRAKKKVDALIGFYWHFAVYVVVNVFLILLIVFKIYRISWFVQMIFKMGFLIVKSFSSY